MLHCQQLVTLTAPHSASNGSIASRPEIHAPNNQPLFIASITRLMPTTSPTHGPAHPPKRWQSISAKEWHVRIQVHASVPVPCEPALGLAPTLISPLPPVLAPSAAASLLSCCRLPARARVGIGDVAPAASALPGPAGRGAWESVPLDDAREAGEENGLAPLTPSPLLTARTAGEGREVVGGGVAEGAGGEAA
mmetsp:Transcript_16917/g.46707  ORF Transcript_16917/g.46707 Transcript_16917/m.46707 type:complete len:193 (-) Transcript_16917:4348-4926(-)|eukprot:scaffold115742_cov19-Tisochrysis_lutea.AAC.3